MKLTAAQFVSVLALCKFAEAGAAKVSKKQTVITQGGISLTTGNDQTKTVDLRAGDLAAGTYKYILIIHNGTMYDMSVSDSSRRVYADTAPGWGWSSMLNANEMAFTLGRASQGITFSASTESQEVDFDYQLVLTK